MPVNVRPTEIDAATIRCEPSCLIWVAPESRWIYVELLLLLHRCPGLVRIEAISALKELKCLRPKIFFPDDAVLTHHETLDAGVSILGRRSEQGKAADHLALDHVVQFSQRRGWALALEHFKEIPVIRFVAIRVPSGDRRRDFLTDWSIPSSVSVLPRETVLLSGRADDPLRVLIHAVSFLRNRIFVLCLDIAAADFDRVQLIAADAAKQKFLSACFGVKVPTVARLNDGHRHRPIVVADDDLRTRLRLVVLEMHLCARLRRKRLAILLIARRFAGMNNVIAAGPEDFGERSFVVLLGGADQGIGCRLR